MVYMACIKFGSAKRASRERAIGVFTLNVERWCSARPPSYFPSPLIDLPKTQCNRLRVFFLATGPLHTQLFLCSKCTL